MRPFGVTLVGFYQIARAGIGLVFGLFVSFYKGPANKLASVAARGNAIERLVGGFGHAAGLVIIGFAVVHMIAGYGVLQTRNWGRFITILFSGIELVLILPGMVNVNIFSLSFGAINAACIFYLVMPPIGRAFHAEEKVRTAG
jgi:hypothetical protein